MKTKKNAETQSRNNEQNKSEKLNIMQKIDALAADVAEIKSTLQTLLKG